MVPTPTPPAVVKAMLTAISNASPIGAIPSGYKHLPLLMKKAYIGYHLKSRTEIEKIPTHVKKEVEGVSVTVIEYQEKHHVFEWRDWYVCWDEKMAPARRKTPTGRVKLDWNRLHRTCMGHAKFCAIVHYMEYRAQSVMKDTGIDGKLDRTNVLNIACQAEDENGHVYEFLMFPDGSSLQIGPKVAELWNKTWDEVFSECASLGMHEYQATKQEEQPKEEEENKAPKQSSLL